MPEIDLTSRRDVSRETLERLRGFADLVQKWNPAINLIAKGTMDDLWSRHILDSAQIFDLAPRDAEIWADVGSGGGFPGLVVAIIAASERPALGVTLIESDQRKAAFLRQVAVSLDLRVSVRAERAERIAPLQADVLSARALAPLSELLAVAARHLQPDGVALFPKGARYRAEVDKALERWSFSYQKSPSIVAPDGVILAIKGVHRV